MELRVSKQTGHMMLGSEGQEGGTVELLGMEEVWGEGAMAEMVGDMVRSMVMSIRDLAWGVPWKFPSSLLLFCISMNAAPIGDTG